MARTRNFRRYFLGHLLPPRVHWVRGQGEAAVKLGQRRASGGMMERGGRGHQLGSLAGRAERSRPAADRGACSTLKDGSGLSLAQISARTHYSRASWERWFNGKSD